MKAISALAAGAAAVLCAPAGAAVYVSGGGGDPLHAVPNQRVFTVEGSYSGAPPFTAGEWSDDGLSIVQTLFPLSGTFKLETIGSTRPIDQIFLHYNVFANGAFLKQSNLGGLQVNESTNRIHTYFQTENSAFLEGSYSFAIPAGLLQGQQPNGQYNFALGSYDIGNGATLTISAVPEPATWLMMIVGFGFIGWRLRSKPSLGPSAPASLFAPT